MSGCPVIGVATMRAEPRWLSAFPTPAVDCEMFARVGSSETHSTGALGTTLPDASSATAVYANGLPVFTESWRGEILTLLVLAPGPVYVTFTDTGAVEVAPASSGMAVSDVLPE